MKNKRTTKIGNLLAISLFVVMFVSSAKAQENVGIGTDSPDPSAILHLSSDSKGLLIPILTSGQRLAIVKPQKGLLVYDQDASSFFYNKSTSLDPPEWLSLVNKDASGNVGIGTNTPARTLHVNSVMRLEPIPAAPASPAKGDMYFDSTLNKLRVYDGTAWQNCW